MKRLGWMIGLIFLLVGCGGNANREDSIPNLPDDIYFDKLHGAWQAAMIANHAGLPLEGQFLDEPNPANSIELALLDEWSTDDDTAIEWVTMHILEEHGMEPTPAQIRDEWVDHLNHDIWNATLKARQLMDEGYLPPDTGSSALNPDAGWTIGAQLQTELFGMIAPGMPAFAAQHAQTFAQITNNGPAVEASQFYAIMYAEAFFEDDVPTLIAIAQSHLPPDSIIREISENVVEWYTVYPDDWRQTRRLIRDYYDTDPSWWASRVNFASTIMALLYGDGDMMQTITIAGLAGWDADNNMTSSAGLLGIIYGFDNLPDPIRTATDVYFNEDVTGNLPRYTTVTAFAERTFALGKLVIGGEEEGGTRRQGTWGLLVFLSSCLLVVIWRRDWRLFFLWVGLVGYAGIFHTHFLYNTLRAQYTWHTIGWYLVAFGGYVGILVLNERPEMTFLRRNDISSSRELPMSWLWTAAILFRIILLFTTPTLSDDIYRYLWDGHVANNGVSPYLAPINSPELDYLDVPIRGLANNTWMASPYLPAAQAVFAGITRLFPLEPFYLQATMLIFDLLTGWLIAKLLAIAKLPPRYLAIYLLNPLIILESTHGAHLDAYMACLSLLAVYFTLTPKLPIQHPISNIQNLLSPLLLALATLTKILPAFLLPILFWRWTWKQIIGYGLLVVGLLVPFGVTAGWGLVGELDGRGLFGALRIYGNQWDFNSGLFHWLQVWLENMGSTDPDNWAKRMVGVAQLAVLGIVWLFAQQVNAGRVAKTTSPYLESPVSVRERTSLRLMTLPFMAHVLLATTMHPWYIMLLLALLPFLAPAPEESGWQWLWLAPWLYLSGALIFSYLTYLDPNDFRELEWVRWLEWMPAFLLLISGLAVPFFQKTNVTS